MKKGRKAAKNKKIIIALCCVAAVFAAVALIVHQTTKITNDSYANCSIGDVNGDGFINSSDSLLIIESTADNDLLFDNQKLLADVNKDGEVNSADVLILLRYTVGEVKAIPYIEEEQEKTESRNNSRAAECETEKSFSTVQLMNEWDNGDGTHSYQYNVTVKNIGEEDIGGWNAVVSLSSPVELSKSWDCKCKANSDEIIVRNSSIPTESAAVCGFIVTAPEGLTVTGIKTED